MSRTPVRVAALVAAALIAALAPIEAAYAGPPDTTITSGPEDGAVALPGPVQYAFTSDIANPTFECKVDNGAFATCTSPVTYDLAPGGHTFTVRAVDNIPQPDPTPASRIWTVRNVPCEQAGLAYLAARAAFYADHMKLAKAKTKLQKAKQHDQENKAKRLKRKIKKIKKEIEADQAAMDAAIAQQHAVC